MSVDSLVWTSVCALCTLIHSRKTWLWRVLCREILLLNATGVLITQVDIPMGRFQDIYIISTAHTSPEGGQHSVCECVCACVYECVSPCVLCVTHTLNVS